MGRAADQDVIVSGSADRTLRIWNAATASQVGSPLTGRAEVTSVACTILTGQPVAITGDKGGLVRIFELRDAAGTETLAADVQASGTNVQASGTKRMILRGHTTTGALIQTSAVVGEDVLPVRGPLRVRRLVLDGERELWQLHGGDDADRRIVYERLDNEIMAGLRLARAASPAGYPPEVSRLYGYESESAAPYALLLSLPGRDAGRSRPSASAR